MVLMRRIKRRHSCQKLVGIKSIRNRYSEKIRQMSKGEVCLYPEKTDFIHRQPSSLARPTPSRSSDQNEVPPEKRKNWVRSYWSLVMALAKSKRIGPSGEDQIKLVPTEERIIELSCTFSEMLFA